MPGLCMSWIDSLFQKQDQGASVKKVNKSGRSLNDSYLDRFNKHTTNKDNMIKNLPMFYRLLELHKSPDLTDSEDRELGALMKYFEELLK